MRITIHIGAWKTGSTAIQAFLTANRDILHRSGVFVPESMERPTRVEARKRMISSNPVESRIVLDEYAALGERATDANVVVASEHFWPLASADIQRMGENLSQITDDVRILLYVRPQDDMWNSLYAQQAKSFRISPDTPLWGTSDFVSNAIADWALFYHRCLGMFVDVFGQDAVQARLYRRDRLRGGDVALDFIEYLGVDDPDLMSPRPTSNPSLGWKGVAFSKWAYADLNVRGRGDDDFNALRGAFRSVTRKMEVATGDPAWMGKAPNILTTAQRREIRDHYAEDNQRLFDTYFGGEDVFGDVREKPVDSMRHEDIPADEFRMAKQKMLNVLRKRSFDVTEITPILAGRRKAAGIKGLLETLFAR